MLHGSATQLLLGGVDGVTAALRALLQNKQVVALLRRPQRIVFLFRIISDNQFEFEVHRLNTRNATVIVGVKQRFTN